MQPLTRKQKVLVGLGGLTVFALVLGKRRTASAAVAPSTIPTDPGTYPAGTPAPGSDAYWDQIYQEQLGSAPPPGQEVPPAYQATTSTPSTSSTSSTTAQPWTEYHVPLPAQTTPGQVYQETSQPYYQSTVEAPAQTTTPATQAAVDSVQQTTVTTLPSSTHASSVLSDSDRVWLKSQLHPGGSLFTQEYQLKLARLGYAAGEPDGIIGPVTRAAIAAFQRAYGLRVSQSFDVATTSAIDTAYASSRPYATAGWYQTAPEWIGRDRGRRY